MIDIRIPSAGDWMSAPRKSIRLPDRRDPAPRRRMRRSAVESEPRYLSQLVFEVQASVDAQKSLIVLEYAIDHVRHDDRREHSEMLPPDSWIYSGFKASEQTGLADRLPGSLYPYRSSRRRAVSNAQPVANLFAPERILRVAQIARQIGR